MIKFFNNYVIEVKTEKNNDKLQIYDFDNKLSLFNASYPKILQVEVETEERKPGNKDLCLTAKSIYMHVQEKNGRLAVYQLTELENNLKIELLLKKTMFKEAQAIAI